MIVFKGFDDWVPIFQGGIQTDSRGRKHDGDALIDKAILKFNAARHEPPACIGHPEDNKPAYGWVEGLKKVAGKGGNLLLAKFRQVEPTFEGMVKAGRFKKRSAAFYPDGSLRHVAFLGAAPPAVKGLPDMAFTEEADAVFEFAESDNWKWEQVGDMMRRLREWLIDKFDQDTADRVVSQWAIEDIRAAPSQTASGEIQSALYREHEEDNDMTFKEKLIAAFNEFIGKIPDDGSAAGVSATGGTFTEADLAAARKQAADDAAEAERKKLTAEFAEKDRVALLAARKSEIAAWCDKMVAVGKLTPAMVKYGVPQFMEALAEKADMIQFGEGDDKVQATLYDRFKGLFETELPKVVEFGEVATRDKDTGGQGQAGAKVEALIREKMKNDKTLGYGLAFTEVQRENPDLVREYQQEIGG